MIDIAKILKHAWFILWNYRVLWIFGVLLAITAGGFRTSGNAGSGSSYDFNGSGNNTNFPTGPFLTGLKDWFQQNIKPLFTNPSLHIATFIWIGVGLFLLLLIIGTLMAFLRYVSETAVIRMVDDYERSETKVGFRQGWKLGWSRRAFHLWVIDLVISLPVIVFLLLMALLGLGIYFGVKNGSGPALVVSVAAIGCIFLLIFVFVILMISLGLLRPFFARLTVLENTSIGVSFRRGWQMVRQNWKSAGLVWLVMIAIGIATAVASILLFILLIPVFGVTAIAGLVVAAIPGAIAFGISSIFTSGSLTWIIAAIVALPFLLLVLFSPLFLIGGWVQVYTSSVWTLAFREMQGLETTTLPEVPAPIV